MGGDKTVEKICSRFFWKNMSDKNLSSSAPNANR